MCVRAICLLLAFFLSFRFYFAFFSSSSSSHFHLVWRVAVTQPTPLSGSFVRFFVVVVITCFAAFFSLSLCVPSAAIVPYEIQMPTSCRLLALYFWFWFSEACASAQSFGQCMCVRVCSLGGNYECPAIVYKLMGLLVTVRIWFDVLLNLHQIVFARETRYIARKKAAARFNFSNWIHVALRLRTFVCACARELMK